MTRALRGTRILQALNRPGFTIIVVLGEIMGMRQRGSLPSLAAQVGITIGILAWMVASTALNDVADEAIDRVNLVDDARRVLVTGLATRRQLTGIAIAMGCTAVMASMLGGWRPVIIMTAGLALSAAYSLPPFRLSDRGALTSLLLPVGYAGVPFLLAATAAPATMTSRGWWTLLGLAVALVGRLALKDFRDVDGDRLFGKRTLLVRHGRRRVCAFTAAFYAAGSVPLLLVTRVDPVIVVDAAILSALTIALVVRLSARDDNDTHTISDIALLGRGQLVLVAVALGQDAHRLSSEVAMLAASAVLFATLFSSWIDHSRFRYEPGSMPLGSVSTEKDASLVALGASNV